MKLRALNESVEIIVEGVTMTQVEIITKVLKPEKKFETYLKTLFKPKTEGGRIDYQKALLGQSLNVIKKQLTHFIKKVLGASKFEKQYQPTLSPMKIMPLEW